MEELDNIPASMQVLRDVAHRVDRRLKGLPPEGHAAAVAEPDPRHRTLLHGGEVGWGWGLELSMGTMRGLGFHSICWAHCLARRHLAFNGTCGTLGKVKT